MDTSFAASFLQKVAHTTFGPPIVTPQNQGRITNKRHFSLSFSLPSSSNLSLALSLLKPLSLSLSLSLSLCAKAGSASLSGGIFFSLSLLSLPSLSLCAALKPAEKERGCGYLSLLSPPSLSSLSSLGPRKREKEKDSVSHFSPVLAREAFEFLIPLRNSFEALYILYNTFIEQEERERERLF